MTELRPYQQDAIIEIYAAWSSHMQRPAVVLPTGAGKTVIFARLASVLARAHQRPLILVNRDELVRQTVRKLNDADPQLSVGVIQADRHETGKQVTVASVQTLSRQKRLDSIHPQLFNRIICDEAHYAAADSWRRVLGHFGAFDKESDTKIVGFTATMTRTDKRGLGEIWDDVVFKRSTRWAIEKGFLVPVRAQTVTIPDLDLAKVKVRNGDLSDGDLGKAMSQAQAGPLIAAAYRDLAVTESGEIRRGIVFAPTIETAEGFLLDFRHAGIPTSLVIGSTPTAERQAAYEATRQGVNRVLMSVGVLTTGFDLPAVEVAVIARPTKSKGLYQQMVGRVLRPSFSTGKVDALILDVVGVSRLGLAELIDLQLDQPIKEGEEDLPLDDLGAPIITPVAPPETPEEIGFREIDPFSGMPAEERSARKKLERMHGQRSHWDMTDGGISYLPPSETFPFYVALYPHPDGHWQTWKVAKHSNAAYLEGDLKTFPEAMLIAHEIRGTIATLGGPASDAQIRAMITQGIEIPAGMTKQEASRAMTRRFASRRLDA